MKFFRKIFKLTPFRLAVAITLVSVTLSLVYDVRPDFIPLLQTLEQKSLDIKFRFRGTQKPKSKILIVAADEKSFQKFGQWPFDRSAVFANSLDRICKYNPRVVGLDVVWADIENKMPLGVRNAVSSMLGSKATQLDKLILENSGDYRLRQVFESCQSKMVLGYAFGEAGQAGLEKAEFEKRLSLIQQGTNIVDTRYRGKVVFQSRGNLAQANVDFSSIAQGGVMNLPNITPPGIGQGFFNNEQDHDGNYRRGLMLYKAGEFFVPSLSLRMAQKVLSPQDASLKFHIQGDLPEQAQTQELRLEIPSLTNMRRIPIDLRGHVMVNYRGPNHTYPNISLADVLDPEPTIAYKLYETGEWKTHKIHKSELFKDSLVLLGVTAVGLYDIRPRPLDPAASGVENHANILDNIINDDFLVRPTSEMMAELSIVILALSLLYGFIVTKLSAKLGALFAATSISGLLYFDQIHLFNQKGIVFFGYLQALQLLVQYICITVLKYIQEESEKKFIRSAFDKYVAPTIVDSMIKDPSKLRLGGEKRELSIMFSDIRSFTEISEKMDVKALTQLLNTYLGSMTDILQHNNGTLDKYIGDAVMCFWGAPVDVKDHATCAVRTAVQMLNKVDELNVEFEKKYGLKVDIGIGINSGAVSVGNLGSSKVFAYTVIGDNVNLASRLEGLNKYYGTHVIVSEQTFQLLPQNEFQYRAVDTVKVKGKHKPVKIYEIFPDNPAHAPLKEVIPVFNNGLLQYYARQWDRATQSFQSVLAVRQNDKPSLEMLERIKYYLDHPPGQDWDGSWEMHTK